jgi:hypothetical protein
MLTSFTRDIALTLEESLRSDRYSLVHQHQSIAKLGKDAGESYSALVRLLGGLGHWLLTINDSSCTNSGWRAPADAVAIGS